MTPARRPRSARAYAWLAPTIAVLALSGCTFEILLATVSVPPGGRATYQLELVNDQVQSTDMEIYGVIHLPTAWSFASASYTATAAPVSGTGTVVPDPGFSCDTGSLPSPGFGRRREVVSFGSFPVISNPDSGVATIQLDAGPALGSFLIDFHVVLQRFGQSACSVAQTASTTVEPALFEDGFESGNLTAWSSFLP